VPALRPAGREKRAGPCWQGGGVFTWVGIRRGRGGKAMGRYSKDMREAQGQNFSLGFFDGEKKNGIWGAGRRLPSSSRVGFRTKAIGESCRHTRETFHGGAGGPYLNWGRRGTFLPGGERGPFPPAGRADVSMYLSFSHFRRKGRDGGLVRALRIAGTGEGWAMEVGFWGNHSRGSISTRGFVRGPGVVFGGTSVNQGVETDRGLCRSLLAPRSGGVHRGGYHDRKGLPGPRSHLHVEGEVGRGNPHWTRAFVVWGACPGISKGLSPGTMKGIDFGGILGLAGIAFDGSAIYWGAGS